MRVVLLGSSDMLYNMIEGVLASGSQIVGVMNWKQIKKHSIKDYFTSDYTQNYIKKLKLHQIKAKSANSEEFKQELLQLDVDVLLVGTWGEKIKKEIFDIPKIASINIHPALLPQYRGPNPYSRAIMFGEKKTGITFHLINENFDSGAILLQKEFDIYKTDNSLTLKKRLCKQVAPLSAELMRKLNSEIIPTIKQDETQASYYSHVNQTEIVVEPHLMSFEEIDNRVRGLAPFQSTYLLYKGEYFKIYGYKLVSDYILPSGCNLCIKTKDNKFIYFEKLRVLGKIRKYFTAIILNLLQ